MKISKSKSTNLQKGSLRRRCKTVEPECHEKKRNVKSSLIDVSKRTCGWSRNWRISKRVVVAGEFVLGIMGAVSVTELQFIFLLMLLSVKLLMDSD